MTEQSSKILKWSVPILATLTALIAVEELREMRGVIEILGLILAVATAVFGYLAAVAKPDIAPPPAAAKPTAATK